MKRLLIRALGLAALLLLVDATTADDKPQAGGITVDKETRTVTIDAKIAPRKLPNLQETYPIEVIACWGHTHKPPGKKAHETIMTIDVKPSEVHKALESVGAKPGKPVMGGDGAPQGPAIAVFIEVAEGAGKPRRIPLEKALVDPKTNKPMPKVEWRFTGSVMSQPDPEKDDKVYGADMTGTLMSIFPVTNETVFQTSLTMKEEKYLKLETNKEVLPKEGTPVKIVMVVPK